MTTTADDQLRNNRQRSSEGTHNRRHSSVVKPNRDRLTNELVCIEGRLKEIRNTTSSSHSSHRQLFSTPTSFVDSFSSHRRDRMMRNGDDRRRRSRTDDRHHRSYHNSRSPIISSSRRRTPSPRQSSNNSNSRSRSKAADGAKPPVSSHRHRPSLPAEKVSMNRKQEKVTAAARNDDEKHKSSSSPVGKLTKKVPTTATNGSANLFVTFIMCRKCVNSHSN